MNVLVLGGTRSGKSLVAEQIAAARAGDLPVTYAATLVPDPTDGDIAQRLLSHQERRPANWRTIECLAPTDLIDALLGAPSPVIVDSLGSWLGSAVPWNDSKEQIGIAVDELSRRLVDTLRHRKRTGATTVLVSDEVGLSVHPPTQVGRLFADALGTLNRRTAEVCDDVLLVVAGRVALLETFDAQRWSDSR